MTEQHTHNTHAEHDHEEHVGHIVPVRTLVGTAVALLILTVITVAVAKVDFTQYQMPEMNIIVALAVAVVKGTLVCLFFMHLRWDKPFNAFVLVFALAFVALMIGFSMLDTFEYSDEVYQYQLTELQGGEAPAVQQKLQQQAAQSE